MFVLPKWNKACDLNDVSWPPSSLVLLEKPRLLRLITGYEPGLKQYFCWTGNDLYCFVWGSFVIFLKSVVFRHSALQCTLCFGGTVLGRSQNKRMGCLWLSTFKRFLLLVFPERPTLPLKTLKVVNAFFKFQIDKIFTLQRQTNK